MAESEGAGPADSYIGSLISLTSKSEIRYEGLLYTVDTKESNIALQNVRSFGTEGRNKNGPQIPPSDKVYEFIIFRGTDIKDLQVKMSPPQSIHSDPAIISLQAQVSQPAVVPPFISPPVANLLGNQSTYKANSVPYFHTANSGMPSWAPPPPPQVPSGSMPFYWQGFYRPQDEHRLLEPLSLRDSIPNSTRAPPEAVTSAVQAVAVSSEKSQISAQALTDLDSTRFPSGSPTASNNESVNLDQMGGVGTSTYSINSQPFSSTFTSPQDVIQDKSDVDVPLLKPKNIKERLFNDIRNGNSTHGILHPSSSASVQSSRKASGKSHQAYKQVYRQVQVAKDTSSAGHQGATPKSNSAQPLLPLPISPSRGKPLFQDGALKSNFMRRGGKVGGVGRPNKNAQSRLKFSDEFDFIAMNEKFNKEEVWDELLKVEYKDRVTVENGAVQGIEYSFETKDVKEFDGILSEFSKKVVYVKDQFFDSLSCDALDREHGRKERLKFSEQRKLDAETFGSYHVRSFRGGGAFRGRHGGAARGQSRGGSRARGGHGYSGGRGG